MANPSQTSGPPEAPKIARGIRFGKVQLAGLILIVLIPIAAIAGLFGESWAEAEGRTTDLRVRMRYADRYRYKQINSFEIFVRNVSAEPIDTVTVSFDTAFVLEFSTVVFQPAASEPFTVPITDILPGETRLVVAEMQGEHYGRHDGEVTVTSGGADTVRIPVHTIIFP